MAICKGRIGVAGWHFISKIKRPRMQKYWNKMKSVSKCRTVPRLKAEKLSLLRQLQRYINKILFNLHITRLTLMVKDILKHMGKNIH